MTFRQSVSGSNSICGPDSTTGQQSEVKTTANAFWLWLRNRISGERNPDTTNEYLVAVPEWNETIVASTGIGSVIVGVAVPCIVKAIKVGGSSALAGDVSRRDGAVVKEPQCLKLGAATATGQDLHGIRHETNLTLVFAAAAPDQVLVTWRSIG